jgi:glycosyltransferase involved in cell wall biosynthesis
MIVKNESKIITRLLDSVKNIIDSYVICDTGSTDNTIELIEHFFKNTKITGKIITEPFKDFGYNRTVAIKACEGEKNADYILLLDADMKFEIKMALEKFKEKLLTADVFHVFQGNPHFYYKNARIVKNNIGCTYRSVTHEYLNSPPNSKYSKFETNEVFILDIGDGGAKTDKFERDIRLLKKGLEDEPNNERYMFYLANSLKDAGHKEEAIEMYKKRIDAGGWVEECFFSAYNIGNIYKNDNEMEKAIYYYLEAYNIYPNRIENLYEIIKYYRLKGKNAIAYHFYTLANYEKNKNKSDDYLFMHKDIYDYKLDYELSIVGYYGNKDKFNLPQTCMNILACYTTDEGTVRSVLSNYKFYTTKMIDNNVPNENTNILTNLPKMDFGEHFVSSTPSLCVSDNELILNVRYVNYKINEKGGYENQDKIHTHNIIYTFDISKEKWGKKKNFVLKYNTELDNHYVGLEDVRLFVSKNNVLYYNANRGLNDETGHKMKVEHGIIVNETTQSDIITIDEQRNIEKNWVLFKDNNSDINIIYGWYPLIIGKIEGEIGSKKFKKTHLINTPNFFKHLRGSTNGVTIGDEIWFINHIVSYEDKRYYYHIFVVVDAKTFELKKYTPLFTFEKSHVEYTLGFIINDLNQFVIGYSVLDKTTKFITIPKKIIDNMFI